MLDYYGDILGPNKDEANRLIFNNINNRIKNETYLKYLSNNEKIEIINNIVEINYTNITSYSGWCTFVMNNLVNICLSKLEQLNIQKKTIFLCKLKIFLKKKINDNCIQKILMKFI